MCFFQVCRKDTIDPSTVCNTLNGIAGALASVLGFLSAAIVLGLQFHAQSLGQAAFLLRYLVRREGLLPLVASLFAFVCANLSAAAISSSAFPMIAPFMLNLDIFCILPLACILTLWLLYRMMQSISTDFVDASLIPGVTWEFMRVLDDLVYVHNLQTIFDEWLIKEGIQFGHYFENLEKDCSIIFQIDHKGEIRDIDLHLLKYVSDTVRRASSTFCFVVTFKLGDDAQKKVVAKITSRSQHLSADQIRAKLPERLLGELTELLSNIIVVKRVPPTDVGDVLVQLAEKIGEQGIAESSAQLSRALAVYRALLEVRLSRPDARKLQLSITGLEGWFPERQYFSAIHAACDSGDRARIDALSEFALHLAWKATVYNLPTLFATACDSLSVIYWKCIRVASLADFIGGRMDTYLHSLCFTLEIRQSDADVSTISERMPLLRVFYRCILSLFKSAVDANRIVDALAFQDRIFEWDDIARRRFQYDRDLARIDHSWQHLLDYCTMVQIIAAAWVIRSMFLRRASEELVTKLIVAVFQSVHKPDLLPSWECAVAQAGSLDTLAQEFGVRDWPRDNEKYRAGKVYDISPNDSWIFDGLIALLLMAAAHSEADQGPPVTDPGNEIRNRHSVQVAISTVLGTGPRMQESLGLTDVNREQSIVTVHELLASRRRHFKLARLKSVVSIQIGPEQIEATKSAISKGLATQDHPKLDFASNLVAAGQIRKHVNIPPAAQVEWQDQLLKESFDPNQKGPENVGEHIAWDLARLEWTVLSEVLERSVSNRTEIDGLNGLSAAISTALSDLQSRGYSANILLVTGESSFDEQIFGVSRWQLPKHREFGDAHLGDWNGLHVFEFIHSHANSIVVMDATHFLATIENIDKRCAQFAITDDHANDHSTKLAMAESEPDDEKILTTFAFLVDVRTSVPLRFGITDADAAVAIHLPTASSH